MITLRQLLPLAVFAAHFAPLRGAETDTPADEAAYTQVITGRADKIVSGLDLKDPDKKTRVLDIIIRQYRDLNNIHRSRDAALKEANEKSAGDKSTTQAVREESQVKLDKLHAEFLARLSVELTPEQVDQVKDGLTYGVLPLTYSVYLKMYPDLTSDQKSQIKAWLTEAREVAMDGSTSDEKHAAFGKYKGRINNYLSKAGYNAKEAEKNLKKPAKPASNTNAN